MCTHTHTFTLGASGARVWKVLGAMREIAVGPLPATICLHAAGAFVVLPPSAKSYVLHVSIWFSLCASHIPTPPMCPAALVKQSLYSRGIYSPSFFFHAQAGPRSCGHTAVATHTVVLCYMKKWICPSAGWSLLILYYETIVRAMGSLPRSALGRLEISQLATLAKWAKLEAFYVPLKICYCIM